MTNESYFYPGQLTESRRQLRTMIKDKLSARGSVIPGLAGREFWEGENVEFDSTYSFSCPKVLILRRRFFSPFFHLFAHSIMPVAVWRRCRVASVTIWDVFSVDVPMVWHWNKTCCQPERGRRSSRGANTTPGWRRARSIFSQNNTQALLYPEKEKYLTEDEAAAALTYQHKTDRIDRPVHTKRCQWECWKAPKHPGLDERMFTVTAGVATCQSKGDSGSSICCQEDAASYNQWGLTPQHERNKWKTSQPQTDSILPLENTDLHANSSHISFKYSLSLNRGRAQGLQGHSNIRREERAFSAVSYFFKITWALFSVET